MRITFNKLHIENFLSIGCADIELDRNGYTLINGENRNEIDGANSNGCGKTSIAEALSYVLTNETIRGSREVVNFYGNDGALVELEFRIGDNEYKLIRTKEHSKYKNSLRLYINGEDKSGKGLKSTGKILEEYLPELTSELINSVIILGQGLPQRFSNNTPAGRKEVLETLSRSDFMIEDLKERLQGRRNPLIEKIARNEKDIIEKNTSINILKTQVNNNTIKVSKLLTPITTQELIYNLEKALKELDKQYEEYKQKKNKIEEDYNLHNTNKEILQRSLNEKQRIKEEKVHTYIELKQARDKEIQNISNSVYIERKQLDLRYATIGANIRVKESELNNLKRSDGKCPTCGQIIKTDNKINIIELEEELKDLREELKECENKVNVLLGTKRTEAETIDSQYTTLIQIAGKEVTEIESKISEVTIGINNITQTINRIKQEEQTITSKYNMIVKQREQYQQRLMAARIEIEKYESQRKLLEETIKTDTEKIEVLKKDIENLTENKFNNNKHLEAITTMYNITVRDFRGYLLKNIIDYISKKSKEYSKIVFGNEQIDFTLNENRIDISFDGKCYESLSGGERVKCDIIIQFAIRSMLCVYLDFSSNILFLDEIFDNLDNKGTERILNLITQCNNDVESIFIISHHQDLQIPFDHLLQVVKEPDKISHVDCLM